jgi:hypothetical protein
MLFDLKIINTILLSTIQSFLKLFCMIIYILILVFIINTVFFLESQSNSLYTFEQLTLL